MNPLAQDSQDAALSSTLAALEAQSRALDTSGDELTAWLGELAAFSREFLARTADGPAWNGDGAGPPAPNPLPLRPATLQAVLEEYRELVLTRGILATSGRFFGYVPGGALPSAAIGDYVAALTNSYAGVYGASPGGGEIENSAVRWMIEVLGFPDTAWGTLQSGGTLATLTAVVAARETRPAAEWPRGVIYVTDEAHVCVRKSLHIAGLGAVPLRVVATDDQLRMSVPDLEAQIEQDRARGETPWMVFASAGTVNTGVVDPLAAIADVARKHGIWFHVDAAYGGFFLLTKRARARFAGIERADSVVLDPHKGLFLPYGCGAVVVRDEKTLRKGFTYSSDYLDLVPRAGVPSPADYSPELTRHFRALRLWTSLKVHGLERYRAALEEKLILAQLAHRGLTALERIETLPAPELSCVAFRVRGEGDEATAALHTRVLERGRIHISSTRLWGRLYLRLCVLSFRSHRADVEEAIAEIERAL
jgi:glutamate/tyrosine decarboxylase-like PLP-dependent enzyme